MISRVGEFKVPDAPPETVPGAEGLRPVVLAGAKNIGDLTKVVSKASNVATFLKFIPPPPPPKPEDQATGFGFQRPPPKPEDQAGPMAHLIVSCASTLPLQTNCYAALTLSVHAHSNGHTDYAGFAKRCVFYALQRLSYDMDTLFCSTAAGTAESRPKVACRIKLLLRYLAMLGGLKVIQAQDDTAEADDSPSSMSLLGFLQKLVEAAVAAAPTDDAFGTTSSSNAAAPLVLVYFVLSTIPYLLSYIPTDVIQERLLDPLQTLIGAYASSFTPGVGMTAILLKDEQVEGGDDEDDDEEEDDEEEEEASEVVCDSLQDLNRSVQLLLKEHSDDKPPACRFALLTDQPWKGILGPEPTPPAGAPEGMDTGIKTEDGGVKMEEGVTPVKAEPGTEETPAPPGPLEHPDPPMRLVIPEGSFQSLNILLNAHNTEDDTEGTTSSLKIQAFPLEVVVFGRLPFFGGPQPAGGEEGGDDDDMEEEDAPANAQIAAYSKEFGILDRCFLADAIRDLLCCHQSSVSDIGLERGSAKSVAEQLWSIGHVFQTSTEQTGPPTGMEYGILESVMSLILQSSANTYSTFRQIYLSRVLLELTRLQPALVSPALALGVSNLFQDYCPALVPPARRNLSCWLSFHLVNTDYQWPAAYWMHWQTYTTDSNKLFSRGFVVRHTLQFLTDNVSDPSIVVKDCLPKECTELAKHVVIQPPTPEDGEQTIDAAEKDIRRRIWDDDEFPDTLKAYIMGDELSGVVASLPLEENSPLKRLWCRTGIVMRSLMQPAEKEQERLLGSLEKAQSQNGEDDNAMDEDDNLVDTLSVLQEAVSRYGPVLTAAIGKDREILAQSLETAAEKETLMSAGDQYLVSIVGSKAGFSRSVVEGCLDCLLHEGIISSSGVLRWVLSDMPNSGSEEPKVVERWWEMASEAMQTELRKKKAEVNAQPTEVGGMVIDRAGADEGASAPKTLAVMESLSPLLDYTVRRACTLLSLQGDDPQQGNKLKPHQVDLVEGVKSCVRAAYGLCFSELRKSNENDAGVSEREIQDALLSQSGMTGWKLASICQEFNGHAVNVLRESLGTV